jgi:hypothetical protein
LALYGALDTFPLADVLRLLAATAKSGCLDVEGDRGRGAVWLVRGGLVAASADRVGDAPLDEVIFELLRFGRGTFRFTVEEVTEATGDEDDVEATLRRAAALLEEWHELEVVVPSLSHRVTFAPRLEAGEVVVDAATWELLVALAGGCSVRELAQRLGASELGVSRTINRLVEMGVAVVEPPGAVRPPAMARTTGEAVVVPMFVDGDDLASPRHEGA